MSQLPAANQPPQDPNAAIPVTEPGFEVAVQEFWEKNRGMIMIAIVAVLVAIIGWQGWNYLAASREAGVREDYAKAGESTTKLAAFADANSGHELAGVARLRLADERFAAADYKQSAPLYTKAADSLKNEALLGRAKLGAAVSQLNSGDQAGAEASLKAISADAKLLAGVRAEATYDLATLALDAGKTDEAKKLAEEVSKLDATGPWAQRATLLIASLPAGAKPATAEAGFKLGN